MPDAGSDSPHRAHRLSTVYRADRMVALAEGSIAEIGSHDAPRRNEGLYSQLVAAYEGVAR